MHDPGPVVAVIGRLTVVLGLSMFLAMGFDLAEGNANAAGMALSGFLTAVAGLGLVVITRSETLGGLTRPQAFLLTTGVWLVLPVFGALPFVYGAPGQGYTDAFFEAMSAFTTTGSTVFTGLDTAPSGMLFWRALMQWYGGVGIVVFAMVFLPAMKVGGMQFFRSESFDLGADVLPRAVEIAGSLFWIYILLTFGCMLAYAAAGMSAFDALCHAMTTVSTGGLANYDTSFAQLPAAAQYVAVVVMCLAALPFIRFIQFAQGAPSRLWRDVQVRAFLGIVAVASGAVAVWLVAVRGWSAEPAIRAAFFNVTSILTGTGYGTHDFSAWGGFPVAMFFVVALIGGCTGSTSCSAKVFRYQILFAALTQQIRRIHTPSGVFQLRYDHRIVEPEVLSSVMSFFFVFVALISVWAILLSMLGLSNLVAISGAVAALTNIGPGLGPEIGPAGNYKGLPDSAKWLLAFGMLLGRLEFISVLVLLTPSFWRR